MGLIKTLNLSLFGRKNFNSIQIGNQEWMTEHLNIVKFRNGNPIPQGKTAEDFDKATDQEKPIWYNDEDDSENGKVNGIRYNWWAVNDPRELAPKGWHVASCAEYLELIKYLGGGDYIIAAKKLLEIGFIAISSGQQCIWSADEYINGNEAYYWIFGSSGRTLSRHFGAKPPNMKYVRCIKD